MTELELKQALMERVARLDVMGAPHRQIAQACGLSESRISQIMATEEYREKLTELQTQDLEQAQLMNKGWDAVEEESLGHVLQAVRANPDPEFALRVASTANKAQRRGGAGNQPINGGATAAAVIHLSAMFVEKLQQMQINVGEQGVAAINEQAHKRVDALSVKDAKSLFDTPLTVELSHIFNR